MRYTILIIILVVGLALCFAAGIAVRFKDYKMANKFIFLAIAFIATGYFIANKIV